MSGGLTNITDFIYGVGEYPFNEIVNRIKLRDGLVGYTRQVAFSKYGYEKGNLCNANMERNFGGGNVLLEDPSDINKNYFYTPDQEGNLVEAHTDKLLVGNLYKQYDFYTNSVNRVITSDVFDEFETNLRKIKTVEPDKNSYTTYDTKGSFSLLTELKEKKSTDSSVKVITYYSNYEKLKEYCHDLRVDGVGEGVNRIESLNDEIIKDFFKKTGLKSQSSYNYNVTPLKWVFYQSPGKTKYYSIDEKHIQNLEIEPVTGNFSSQNQLTGKRDYSFYEEPDGENNQITSITSSDGIGSTESIINVGDNTSEIIKSTNETFKDLKNKKLRTLINRFHTDVYEKFNEDELISSYSDYGISRGRNLLTKKAENGNKGDDVNGYDNPYCRVWTALHQYNKLSRRIRPFYDATGQPTSIADTQKEYGRLRPNGKEHLQNNTVLTEQGFVRITPTNDKSRDVKKCMFSIENLAWRDVVNVAGLSQEQIGPSGGRIMWFPPYNLKFNENVNVEWNANKFIGRGEQIYTYTNTDRSGTLSFTLLIDHPAILNKYSAANAYRQKEVENDILRFFAGCGNLDGSYDGSVNNTSPSGRQREDINPRLSRDSIKDIAIVVFYPNNWSGKNFLRSGNVAGGIEELKTYETASDGSEFNDANIDSGACTYGNHDINLSLFKLNNFDSGTTGTESSITFNVQTTIKKALFGVDDDYEKLELYSAFGENGIENLSEFIQNGNISGDSTVKIGSIDLYGSASSHGLNDTNNEALANNRAEFLLQMCFENCDELKDYESSITRDSNNIWQVNEVNQLPQTGRRINLFDAKIGRCAYIVFHIVPKDTPALQTQSISGSTIFQDYGTGTDSGNGVTNTQVASRVSTVAVEHDDYAYDNEYKYFKEIKGNEMVYKYIADKIQYFDPAFHSITPEGFNARLTFLHQCTRQGPTVDLSSGHIDVESNDYLKYAGNLSFGRPPYCILRIGDFFHTKICITSLSIDYDTGSGIQWDLNQEGIGVQPMYANININFNFLGGQDLSGPIERLQNAVTANYYANASVYDNKADVRGSKIYSPMIDTPRDENIIDEDSHVNEQDLVNTGR